MFGSTMMKMAVAILLFVVVPVILMRYMVYKTIEAVHPPKR
jgi:hypothetical protein